MRTKTILSQFVASVQLTGVPLNVAIGEAEFGGDFGVGQTIGMGCKKFQNRELPFLRARHAGDCSTRSYSGVLLIRCGPVVGERVHFVKFEILQRCRHDHSHSLADSGGFDEFHSVRIEVSEDVPGFEVFRERSFELEARVRDEVSESHDFDSHAIFAPIRVLPSDTQARPL